MYSYEDFDKAVAEGHLSGDYEIRLVKICDLKKELENVTLSPVQRQEAMELKEAKSRKRRIIEQNKAFAKYNFGTLPQIDIAVRDDLGGKRHNCNGWHTYQVIWWAMGWDSKKKSWLTEEEKEELSQCYVEIHDWPCHDNEGDLAIWLHTNDTHLLKDF